MSSRDNTIVVDFPQVLETYFTTELVSDIAPTDYHQNNTSLFKLARLVKSYERTIGRAATAQELELVFNRWCYLARRFWRAGLTRDDYYAEFLEAYTYAHTGLNIELAVSRAKAAPLPELQGFTDQRIRLLVAICREMQKIMGEILGVHYSQAARWLRVLRVLEIIRLAPGEVFRPGGNRCPRYHCNNAAEEIETSGNTIPPTGTERSQENVSMSTR